jgi:Kef-type K+ transport system membrane component KefB
MVVRPGDGVSATSRRALGLRSVLFLLVPAIAALTTVAFAQTHEATGAHSDPVTPVVLALAIILAAAKLGGHLAVRMGQPAVLGELVFGLVYLSSFIGLAPIVGAYAAGLILEEVHFRDFANRGEQQLEHLVHPISTFLVPVFFVIMGMRVDLGAFARLDVLGLAALLTLAAIVGKQACSLGALGRKLDRLSIGIGMIPRGEVGLIFANIGLGLTVAGQRVIDEGIFSAVVIMVIVTTMVTPPALKWSLARRTPR